MNNSIKVRGTKPAEERGKKQSNFFPINLVHVFSIFFSIRQIAILQLFFFHSIFQYWVLNAVYNSKRLPGNIVQLFESCKAVNNLSLPFYLLLDKHEDWDFMD